MTIKRIPNVILSSKANLHNIPDNFCLWVWHVKFFYNKTRFLYRRYIDLLFECQKRWFNVTDYWDTFSECKRSNLDLYNDYKPTQEDIKLSRARIEEKIKEKPLFYKYYWKELWQL